VAVSRNPFVLGLLTSVLLHLATNINNNNNFLHADNAIIPKNDAEESVWNPLETNINSLKEVTQPNYIRPRFLRDEINMTQNLFVGFLVVESSPRNFLYYHNTTSRDHVQKTVVFADRNSSFKNESNTVLLKKNSMQQMLEYISIHHHDYSFYLLLQSDSLVNGQQLAQLVRNLTFVQDVVLGVERNAKNRYCDTERGMLINNNALKRILKKPFNSDKIECESQINGVQYKAVSSDADFGISVPLVVNGLKSESTYVKAASSLLKIQANHLESAIAGLNQEIETFVAESEFVEDDWPNVVHKPHIGVDRFDNEEYDYIYVSSEQEDSEATKEIPTDAAILDLLNKMAEDCSPGQHAKVLRGWRKVDMNVGVKWLLELQVSGDNNKPRKTDCSVLQEFSEPLMVSLPFVTESTKISVVVPVSEEDLGNVLIFLNGFAKTCLEKNERVFLMLVFLYTKEHPDKNNNRDFYKGVKQAALQLSKKFKKKDKGSMILWYSMQLKDGPPTPLELMDLLTQKLDSKSIILLGSPYMELHSDYLNRVRMNTIEGRLSFSPIPFTQFHPQITDNKEVGASISFNTSIGHFDNMNHHHFSFYKSDYQYVRGKLDIASVVKEEELFTSHQLKEFPMEVFRLSALFQKYGYLRTGDGAVQNSKSLHVLRAPEPSLRLRYKKVLCSDATPNQVHTDCLRAMRSSLGTRGQLAQLFLEEHP